MVGREEAWSSVMLKQNRERVGLSRVFSPQVKNDSRILNRVATIFDFGKQRITTGEKKLQMRCLGRLVKAKEDPEACAKAFLNLMEW